MSCCELGDAFRHGIYQLRVIRDVGGGKDPRSFAYHVRCAYGEFSFDPMGNGDGFHEPNLIGDVESFTLNVEIRCDRPLSTSTGQSNNLSDAERSNARPASYSSVGIRAHPA